ncbi:hypothetical protein H113_03842 [Trichophyton rubrum MR1459]|nr:hypothetical protein H113_03842 [Trichophyton rubrum MR1459]
MLSTKTLPTSIMDEKVDIERLALRSGLVVGGRSRKRQITYASLVAFALLSAASVLLRSGAFTCSRNCTSHLSPLEQVLAQAPLTDGHNDFPIWTRAYYQNHIYQANFTSQGDLYGQVDFPRLQQGRLGAQFWSAYVECPRTPYTAANESEDLYHEIIRDSFQQIDLVHRMIEHFPARLVPASSAADIVHNFRTSPGRISSLLGIEGLHQIGTSASVLRMYHRLGVRYATLTHTCHNHYADSEAPSKPQHNGLSPAGEAIVAEMNRLGMIVDISHTSFATQRAVLALSRAPVMYSHSSAYAVCPHSRNVPDDILKTLQKNDGIIMITFYPEFTNCESADKASLSDVADHIQYVGNLIGYRHVGLGSDFDGMAHGMRGLEDVSKYPDLIQELLDRGVGVGDLVGVIGGNVFRVLAAVEDVARNSRHILALEDDIKPFFK